MTDPTITEELIADHGLNKTEYKLILKLLGRIPTYTELGILSAMWNEHCSYKSSKKWSPKENTPRLLWAVPSKENPMA